MNDGKRRKEDQRNVPADVSETGMQKVLFQGYSATLHHHFYGKCIADSNLGFKSMFHSTAQRAGIMRKEGIRPTVTSSSSPLFFVVLYNLY